MTPFTIVTDNIKYLDMSLTKQVKNLFDKNVKFLKKEIKELRRWKNVLSSGISIINRVKMPSHNLSIYRFNAKPIKIPTQFFIELGREILRFM